MQATNPGLSAPNLASEIKTNNEKTGVSKKVMNDFLEDIATAKQQPPGEDGVPWVEAPIEIIQRYNRNLPAFYQVLFFTFDGVNVCETGTMQRAKALLALSVEDRARGVK